MSIVYQPSSINPLKKYLAIGILGHLNHGKTALAVALERIAGFWHPPNAEMDVSHRSHQEYYEDHHVQKRAPL